MGLVGWSYTWAKNCSVQGISLYMMRFTRSIQKIIRFRIHAESKIVIFIYLKNSYRYGRAVKSAQEMKEIFQT